MNFYFSSFNVLLTILLLFISLPLKVLAIDCYQCDSNTDLECSEKFDEDYTKLRPQPCDHVFESRYCIKTTGIFEGKIGTQRMCSSRDYGDYCDYIRRPGDERDYRSCVFTCSSNACNHSSTLYVSRIALILLILTNFSYFFANF